MTGRIWALIVTFNRPSALTEMLEILRDQTRRPDHVLVIDNGSGAETRRVAAAHGAAYVDCGDNLGPAGGLALGMQLILAQGGQGDWLLLLDDDDPPPSATSIERLWGFAHTCLSSDPTTAGVGLVGARYDRRSGLLSRAPDHALRGAVPVDYIGGNQLPMYRYEAIQSVGLFERGFFFGFDDLEYGLRIKRMGLSLYADGDEWASLRKASGRLGLARSALASDVNAAAWRRYYGARNQTLLARRYARPGTAFMVAVRAGLGGAMRLVQAKRPPNEVVQPLIGAVHGFTSHMGRTVDPGKAHKSTE